MVRARRWLINIMLMLLSFSGLVCATASEGDALVEVAAAWQVTIPSWAPGSNPCQSSWDGVQCNSQGQVVSLNLTQRGLMGPVPAAIGKLTALKTLDVSNQLKGTGMWNRVTGDLSALAPISKSLENLIVTLNCLNTAFPQTVLEMSNLVNLYLDHCCLSGHFPVGVTDLQKLQILFMGNQSAMTGPLPAEVGNMASLTQLSLWNISFSSTIPAELRKLSKLTYMNIHSCNLFGGLPPELSDLKTLTRLHLYRNTLTGRIPESWRNLVNLAELRLESNYLTGTLSTWLFNSPSLVVMSVANNELTGNVPFINSSTTHFHTLQLECNYLTGVAPNASVPVIHFFNNCFSLGGLDDNDTAGFQCFAQGSCTDFLEHVQNGNECAYCPSGQVISNISLCVCLPDDTMHKTIPIGGVAGGVVAAVTALAALTLCLLYKRKTAHALTAGDGLARPDFFTVQEGGILPLWDAPKGLRRYTVAELETATGGFDAGHQIGVGGFGKVFVGFFEAGKVFAVKCASSRTLLSAQSGQEFRNEVLLLSRLHHKNLVRLEGFCEDNGMQILIYEHMKNGNLHSHLFKNGADVTLDWFKRLEIAVGVAQGLEYLHSHADPPVIHRDVKPSNILLDAHLMAKVSDFGISRVNFIDDTHVSTRPAGTVGYFDPQYFISHRLTTASDVYSYGVVLLELITGQRVIDHDREEYNLVEWVKPRLMAEGVGSIVDRRLHDYPQDVYKDMTDLAITCAAFHKDVRPTMKAILLVLEPHYQQYQSTHGLRSCQRTSVSRDRNVKFLSGGSTSSDMSGPTWRPESGSPREGTTTSEKMSSVSLTTDFSIR